MSSLFDEKLVNNNRLVISDKNIHKRIDKTTYISCYEFAFFCDNVVYYVPVSVLFNSYEKTVSIRNVIDKSSAILHKISPLSIQFDDTSCIFKGDTISLSHNLHIDEETEIYDIQGNIKISNDLTLTSDNSQIFFLRGQPIITGLCYTREKWYPNVPVCIIDERLEKSFSHRTPFAYRYLNYNYANIIKMVGNVGTYGISLDPSIYVSENYYGNAAKNYLTDYDYTDFDTYYSYYIYGLYNPCYGKFYIYHGDSAIEKPILFRVVNTRGSTLYFDDSLTKATDNYSGD